MKRYGIFALAVLTVAAAMAPCDALAETPAEAYAYVHGMSDGPEAGPEGMDQAAELPEEAELREARLLNSEIRYSGERTGNAVLHFRTEPAAAQSGKLRRLNLLTEAVTAISAIPRFAPLTAILRMIWKRGKFIFRMLLCSGCLRAGRLLRLHGLHSGGWPCDRGRRKRCGSGRSGRGGGFCQPGRRRLVSAARGENRDPAQPYVTYDGTETAGRYPLRRWERSRTALAILSGLRFWTEKGVISSFRGEKDAAAEKITFTVPGNLNMKAGSYPSG